MDDRIKKLEYTCCFCDEGIKSGKADPCDINILINIDKSPDMQSSQTFYCHIACFKSKMSPGVGYYFMLDQIGNYEADE